MGGSFGQSLGSFFGGALFVVGIIVSVATLSPVGLGLMGAGYLLLDMSGFFQGKNIILVNASTVMVSDPETYNKVKIDSVVNYDKLGWDTAKYMANYAKSGDAQFRAFFNYGRDTYIDRIPPVRLQTTGSTKEQVERLFADSTGISNYTLQNFSLSPTPPEEEWVLYYLQTNYDYNVSTQLCTINNEMYEMTSHTYDGNNNVYKTTLTPVETYTKKYYTLTEVLVTDYDATDELVTTTVTTRVLTYANNSLVILVDSQDTVDSVTVAYAPIDTVNSSKNIVEDHTEIDTHTGLTDIIVNVPQYPASALFYCAEYTIGDSTRRYLWIQYYTNTENINQLLSGVVQSTEQIDTYPIVMLRNSFQDISHYRPSSISTNIQDYANWGEYFQTMIEYGVSDVRSEFRYKNTKEFLKRININVDDVIKAYNDSGDMSTLRDAYFHFGIRPYDTGQPVSRALYEILEYFDERLHPLEPLVKMALGISCQTFIAEIKWRYLFPEIKNEVIGSVGTHDHYIRDWLIIKQYVTTQIVKEPTWDEAVAAGYSPNRLRYGHMRGEYAGKLYYGWEPLFKVIIKHEVQVVRNPRKVVSYDNDNGIAEWTGEYESGEILYKVTRKPTTVKILVQQYDQVYDGENDYFSSRYGYTDDNGIVTISSFNPDVNSKGMGWANMSWVGNSYGDYDINYDGGPLGDEDPHTRYTLIVKKQISPTQTRTYYMYQPRSLYFIAQDSEDGVADVYLGDEEFWLPLPEAIVNRLSIIEKTHLIGHCMFITFFAYKKQHLNWYETEEFGVIMKALGIVIVMVSIFISIATFNPGPTMTAMQVFTTIAEHLLIAAALYAALNLISTYVQDTFLKIALSVAATAVAMYAGGAFDEFNANTVAKLLEIPVQACDIYTQDLQKKTASILAESQSVARQYDERMKEYEEANKKLASGLSTESLAMMPYQATDVVEDIAHQAYTISCSMFYDLGTVAHRNYDYLYTGFYDRTVSRFCSNQLRIGVLSDN